MERLTDWNALWRELVEIKAHSRRQKHGDNPDIWADRAHEFKEGVKRRWARPDSSREFILSQLDSEATVLDIGAGTGAWSALFAPRVKRVTAVEPSPSMIEVMRRSLEAEGVSNVSIVQGAWPEATVEQHDFSVCSHAMYASLDLAAFLRRMNDATLQTCFLLLRAPSPDGVRAEAAMHIWGQPLDSPNFTIAYNVLLQMGIFANVLMENTGLWKPRTSPSIAAALSDMRRFLGLGDSDEHDGYLEALLRRRLSLVNGVYVWPRDVRSGLIYWKVER